MSPQNRSTSLTLTLLLTLSSSLLAGDQWPSFRGPQASGIAANAKPPANWNGETGVNIRWRTAVPGLGHSSPVIVDDRIYLTTADNGKGDDLLRIGLYGESPDHPENDVFAFKVLCYSAKDGKLIWERTAHSGVPKVKRHVKSSHANATISADGKHLLAFFGSEGLYCYTKDGELLWKKDFGILDAGAFNAPEIQWGFGNSPLIYQDKAIILADVNNIAFLTVLDLATGKELWRKSRDENPTWCTPTVVEHKGRTQILVNGYKHIGGYDLTDGTEIWKLHGGGDIPVPTAVVGKGMVFITNSHGPGRPIYGISLDAQGDISLADGQTANQYVRWCHPRYGAYMPTPILVGDYLYSPNNNGILTCIQAETGEIIYRERIGGGGNAYSASPVSADGKLYFASEEGEIHVVKAGPKYEYLGSNPMGGVLLATPAIAGDMLFVRTNKDLFGVADTGGKILVSGPPTKGKVEHAGEAPKAVALTPLDTNDPVSILKHVDAATRAVDRIRYTVHLEGRGVLAAMAGSLDMTLTAEGKQDGMPKLFVAEAKATIPGAPGPVELRAGSDGKEFYIINPFQKQIHHDLEPSVMGRMGNSIRQGMFVEFNYLAPFNDEINAPSVELLGSKVIGGVDCWEIRLRFNDTQEGRTTWYMGKQDLLPRARLDEFKQNGQEAGIWKEISKLELAPQMAADGYAIPKLEGYTLTNEPLR